MVARLLLTLVLLVLSTASTLAAPPALPDGKARKAAIKCAKAIDQTVAKLVTGKLKSLDACATAVLACVQTKPGDKPCLEKTTGKCSKTILSVLPQAEVAASAKIVKACGTPLRPADLLAGDGLGIGARAAACQADLDLDICSDLPTLTRCLVADGARTAERMFASEQPRARELVALVLAQAPLANLPGFPGCQDCSQAPSATAGKAVLACGAAITKASRTFASAMAKGFGGCLDKVFACLQAGPDNAKCLAKATAACAGAVTKLGTARAKLTTGIDKKCGAAAVLPFATLAGQTALNLDALADDCAALGVTPLATLGDYTNCLRRRHECGVAAALRGSLPRTTEILEAGFLGAAADVLDAAACPAAFPSEALSVRGHATRVVFSFGTSRFLSMTKMTGTGAGSKATTVSSKPPAASPNAPPRVTFRQGAPSRFVPGTSGLVNVWYKGPRRAKTARASLATGVPTMIVAIQRGDFAVEDHLEIPLDPVAAGAESNVQLQIDYDAAPPSCVFDVAFAIAEDGEVSDYTVIEQVRDTVPPATATPVPNPTTTPGPTSLPTSTGTGGVGPTATPNGNGTASVTPSPTGPIPTATATPVFAYALTTTDDTTAPGRTASLILTVTNRTNGPQSATMSFTVPSFTTYGGFGSGSIRNVAFANVAGLTSQSAIIPLLVTSGAGAPPDGTVVTVTFNDAARGVSVTRTFTTDAAPSATLTASTAQGTVAPNGTITYAFAYHNADLDPLADAELSVAVPPGAAFRAAETGVTPGLDGVVRFPLGTLATGATGQRTVSFTANAAAAAPLVVAAELRAGGTSLARASAATNVRATPALAYTLTSIDDAARPGRVALFRLTVTNLTNGSQDATLAFRVPDFTTYGGFGSGSVRSVAFAAVPAGGSESALLPFLLASSASAPPDGTPIDVQAVDGDRGGIVSRTVVADATPAAELAVTTVDGSVAPGGTLAYTLAFDDPSSTPLADAELAVHVPAGAGFVAADGGVAPDPDGVVRWQLGTLAGNASGVRTVWLTAPPSGRAPVVVEASLRNAITGEVVTQASAATTVHDDPAFAYTLTTTDDGVGPGGTATFRVTVTNLTNAPQDATLAFRVPDFTTYGGFGSGTVRSVAFDSVGAGASQSALLPFDVATGASAPPDGTVIALAVDDGTRGGAVSRSVVARSAPPVELTLATTAGTVTPSGTFAYTLAFDNPRDQALAVVELAVRVPTGATFVSADENVAPDADGVVRWPIGTLAGHASGERTVTFAAGANVERPLLVEADVHDGVTHEVLARASAATTVYANPTFAYTLTTTDDDPIVPGRTATFLLTVTNRTNAAQNATLAFRVPDFTTHSGFGAGTTRSVAFSNVAAGASQSAFISLPVTSGAAAPPDGTVIGLLADDVARGGAVSRTVVASAAGQAELKIATAQGTSAPGGAFGYTLSFHNRRADELGSPTLVLPVPAGASFVSADGGGTLGADGIVRWALGTLDGFAGGTRTVQLTTDAGTTTPLLADAELHDSNGEVVAKASAAMAIYAAPAFAYALTTTSDPVSPGQTASFTLQVTNLTNAPQNATLSFRVPDFTTHSGFGAGSVRSAAFSNVAAGGSASTPINLLVTSGASAPPLATPIALTVVDGGRGAVVARTITTN